MSAASRERQPLLDCGLHGNAQRQSTRPTSPAGDTPIPSTGVTDPEFRRVHLFTENKATNGYQNDLNFLAGKTNGHYNNCKSNYFERS